MPQEYRGLQEVKESEKTLVGMIEERTKSNRIQEDRRVIVAFKLLF